MYFETQPLSPELRPALKRTIPQIGSMIIDRPVDIPNVPNGPHKYPDLGMHLFRLWAESLQESTAESLSEDQSPNTQQQSAESLALLRSREETARGGFRTTGKVLGMTLASYKLWKPENRSIEELVAIQKNPKTIAKSVIMLANLPDKANREVEEALSLLDNSYDFALEFDDISYIVEEPECMDPFFAPDLSRLTRDQLRRVEATEGDSCPATKFLVPLWNHMVDIAAADTRYYSADLRLAA